MLKLSAEPYKRTLAARHVLWYVEFQASGAQAARS